MKQVQMSILDVGHGNCSVLEDSKGVVVIDAGPGAVLLEFLEQKGIKTIDVLLISHSDADHLAGAITILESEKIGIKRVRLNSDALKGTVLWDDFLWTLKEKSNSVDFRPALTSGDSNSFNQGVISIEILAPNPYIAAKGPSSTDRQGRLITANSTSAVIRLVRNGDHLALLPGDIDDTGFESLLEDTPTPTAKILVFPHHGGKPTTGDPVQFTRKICRKVKPEIVIFSIGRGKHETPRPEILEAVRNEVSNARIICTQLSKHCAPYVPDFEPKHLVSLCSMGREKRKCCAGTIIISLVNRSLLIYPDFKAHLDFIQSAAPKALCLK